MDPREFCRMAMADYERQWSEARGHQERHPIGAKMRALSELLEQSTGADEFRARLREGCEGDDHIRSMVCQDLAERWDQLSGSGPTAGGRS